MQKCKMNFSLPQWGRAEIGAGRREGLGMGAAGRKGMGG
jgi:hypothetical protein